jgi:hypothetical protein
MRRVRSKKKTPGCVFLSHNSKDKPVALELGLFLVAEGVNIWFDEWKIPPGKSITASVSDALADASHLLLVWSRHAKRSRWVRKEVFSALSDEIENGQITVIPVCLDKTPLPALLRDVKYLRYDGGTEQDRFRIVSAVLDRHPSEEFTRAIVKKYRELIDGGPKGIRACPECGSGALKWEDGDLICPECGWS